MTIGRFEVVYFKNFMQKSNKFDLELLFLRTVNMLVMILLVNIITDLLSNSTQLQLDLYICDKIRYLNKGFNTQYYYDSERSRWSTCCG